MVYGVIVTFKSIKLLSIVKPVWYYNLPDDIERYYLKISKCFSFKNEYNFDYYDSFDDSVMFFSIFFTKLLSQAMLCQKI